MRDTNLVNAPRKHAADRIEVQVKAKMERDIIGATRTAFERSADRIVAAEESALILKKKIENQQRHIEAQAKEIDTLRNELCLKCENYTLAHEGACNGCRWRR